MEPNKSIFKFESSTIRNFHDLLTKNEKSLEEIWFEIESFIPGDKRKYFADRFSSIVNTSEDVQDRMERAEFLQTTDSVEIPSSARTIAFPVSRLNNFYKNNSLTFIEYPSTKWKVNWKSFLSFFESEVAPIEKIVAIIAFGSSVVPLEPVQQIKKKKKFLWFTKETVEVEIGTQWKAPNDLDLMVISEQLPSEKLKQVQDAHGYSLTQDVLNIKQPAVIEKKDYNGYEGYSVIHNDIPDLLHIISMTQEQFDAMAGQTLYDHILAHGVLVAGEFPYEMQDKVCAIWDTSKRCGCKIVSQD